jgi:hypothetical protein
MATVSAAAIDKSWPRTQWLWPAQGDMLEFTTDSGGPIAAQVDLSIATRESPMRPAARLITPLWGSVYAEKLTSMTLPALLAPGNLPALAAVFDVDVVLVTESKLVDYIRQARSFQRLTTICEVKFASLNDLMPCEPGEYGVVLTAAWGLRRLGRKGDGNVSFFSQCRFHHRRRFILAARGADARRQARHSSGERPLGARPEHEATVR